MPIYNKELGTQWCFTQNLSGPGWGLWGLWTSGGYLVWRVHLKALPSACPLPACAEKEESRLRGGPSNGPSRHREHAAYPQTWAGGNKGNGWIMTWHRGSHELLRAMSNLFKAQGQGRRQFCHPWVVVPGPVTPEIPFSDTTASLFIVSVIHFYFSFIIQTGSPTFKFRSIISLPISVSEVVLLWLFI